MNAKTVRLGVVGLGGRGQGMLKTLLDVDGTKIMAVCDLYQDRMEAGVKIVAEHQNNANPDVKGYLDYKELVQRDDLDAVVVFTSWTAHVEVACAAMKAGKRVAFEVGGATSLAECWKLVRTSEETGVPAMMLENCCYGRAEMTVLKMVKEGLFGEIIHCQGGYEHDLRDEIACGRENRHYRFENYRNRNGENYPTHELGPIAKCLDINRGNRMLTLTSMASKSCGLHQWILDHKGADSDIANTVFEQGDIVTTMIKCAHGQTIMLTLDTTLPRPYSRGGRVQGVKGIWMEDNNSIFLEGISPAGEGWDPHKWESFDKYLETHEHPLWTQYRAAGVKGGHDGMDFLVLSAFVESVANQTPPPIDVYDAAAWMSVTALSEMSIAQGSAPVSIPDFTDGKWMTRSPAAKTTYALDCVHEDLF